MAETTDGKRLIEKMRSEGREYLARKSRSKRTSNVRISGDTVFINGQGFSVAPSLQYDFIRRQTGGSGSSAQAAMAMATKTENERKRQEAIKKSELAKLESLRRDVLASKISASEKSNLYKQINEQKKAVVFQSDISSGRVQGVSGFGLSPSEFAKRELLIKTGAFRESSSKDNIFRNLDPLVSSYFVDRSPSASDRASLISVLKSEQFNTARVNLPKDTLNKGRVWIRNINNSIRAIRNDPTKAAFLSVNITRNKNSLINNLKNYFKTRMNFTTRTATLLALYITNTGIGVLTTTGEIIQKPVKSLKVVGKASKAVIAATPTFVKNVAKNPKLYAQKGWNVTKALGNTIKNEGKIFAKLLYTNPDVAIAKIGNEFFIMALVGGGFKIVGKVGSASKNGLTKAFKKVPSATKITLKRVPAGRYVIKEAEKFQKKVDIAKINIEYKKALARAKKARIAAGKKGKTLLLTSPNYKQALNNVNILSDTIARVKTYEFLTRIGRRGGSITKKQANDLLKAVQKQYRNILGGTTEYQALQRLSMQDRFLSVKLIKQGKIKSARIFFNKSFKKIQNIQSVNFIGKTLSNIKRGIKIKIKKIKAPVKKRIKKFKNKLEIRRMKNRAKKFRKKSKWKQVWYGDDRYEQVKVVLYERIKIKAAEDVDKFLKAYRKAGNKVGLGKREELIDLLVQKRLKTWKKTKEYNALNKLSKLNEKYMIEFRAKEKFESAKKLFDKAVGKFNQFKTPTSVFRQRLRIKVRRVKRKVKRKFEVRRQKKFIKKTIRYRMEKARPIRKVTLSQLQKTQSITGMNKFIDRFFKELQLRQKITVSPKTYSQMKNILKKRMKKAIKNGDKAEIRNFGIAIRKLVTDINKKSNRPSIKTKMKPFKVSGKPTPKKFQIKKIPEFEPTAPKGSYVEVKNGQTVLLQKVKTKQIQRGKVVSVQKKVISLAPIIKYATLSLSASALKNIQKSKKAFVPITTQASLAKVLQGSKQDLAVLSAVATATKQSLVPKVIQAVNSKSRTLIKKTLRQVAKANKKPLIRPRIKKPKNIRTLPRKVMTYGFIIKKKGKAVRVRIPPMTLKDALDMGSRKLDYDLQRTGRLVPLGKKNVVAKLPKGVSGYYKRNSKKFRRFRKKKGKRYSLERTIIEKKKYVGDKASEIRALKRKRLTGRKKKRVSKKQTVKRRTTKKTIKRRTTKETIKRKQLKRRRKKK